MARAWIGNSRPPSDNGDSLTVAHYVYFYGSDVPTPDKLPGASRTFKVDVVIGPTDTQNDINRNLGDAIAAKAVELGLTLDKTDIIGYDLAKGK